MSTLLPYLVVGVVSGSVYALAGLGLTLTFKTSGVINFAHGAQAALGAYLFLELHQRMGVAWPLAALLALAGAGVVGGLALERLAAVMTDMPVANRVAVLVGLLVAVQGLLVEVFGNSPLQLRSYLPTHLVRLPGVNVRVDQMIVAGVALAAAIALYACFRWTRLGLATQAVVDDPELLAYTGTSPTRARRLAWIVGSCFAAGSGLLLAPQVGVDAGVLIELVFYAFGAAAVGAFTSLPLTYAGGLGIGIGAALITKYLNTTGPWAALPATLPVLVLFAALIVTPRRRFVAGERTARSIPPLTWTPRAAAGGMVVVVIALASVPAFAGSRIGIFTTGVAFIAVFASLGLLVRVSGHISLSHITFVALGATTFARAQGAGWPWPLALLAAAAVAVPVGAVVALPAIRLSGIYLAVATMAFGLLVQLLVYPTFWLFGGAGTILHARRPALGSILTGSDDGYYYVVLAVVALCVLVVLAIRRGRLGRLLRGLADQPAALEAQGLDTRATTLLVFCITAALAAVAGALIAPVTGSVTAAPYDFTVSLILVAVLFVAGRQPLLGAVVAAGLYVVAPTYLTSANAQQWVPVAFGAAAVVAATAGTRPWLRTLAGSPRTVERIRRSPLRSRLGAAT